MRNYDLELSDVKAATTSELCNLIRDFGTKGVNLDRIANLIDQLNKAWDELTDCLVRQRKERDEQILRLIDELAEAKKGK